MMGLAPIARIQAGRFKQNDHALAKPASPSAHTTWRTPMVEVKPSQAAREAAVKLLFPQGTAAWYDAECDFYILRHRMEAGLEDDHPYVQAFARLEQSAFAAGKRAGLKEAAEIARKQKENDDLCHDSQCHDRACEQVATAIEERANAD